MTDRHIKSGDTAVPVTRSRAELERILQRYGCDAFGFSERYGSGEFEVWFRVPNSPGEAAAIPVKLRVEVEKVRTALEDAGYLVKNGQAERVAWRNLVLWVDAACSASAINLRPMAETFFADLVVTDEAGRNVRLFDHAGPMAARLLTAGTP